MKNATPFIKQVSLAAAISAALMLPAMQAVASEPQKPGTVQTLKTDVKEGWKEGLIEGAYLFNTNLNPLDIDVEVHGSKAILKGYVDSNVSKSLAREIAMSIDGIDDVDNQLKVDADRATQAEKAKQGLLADVSDATITVKVKSKLLANTEVSGLAVDVSTDNREVTLSGKVNNDAERDLVYYIARNTEGVRTVNNKLEIKGSAS